MPGREAAELMDISMPDLDGIAAVRLITVDEDPAGARVLIPTTLEIDEYVLQALYAGSGEGVSGLVDGRACAPDSAEHLPTGSMPRTADGPCLAYPSGVSPLLHRGTPEGYIAGCGVYALR